MLTLLLLGTGVDTSDDQINVSHQPTGLFLCFCFKHNPLLMQIMFIVSLPGGSFI